MMPRSALAWRAGRRGAGTARATRVPPLSVWLLLLPTSLLLPGARGAPGHGADLGGGGCTAGAVPAPLRPACRAAAALVGHYYTPWDRHFAAGFWDNAEAVEGLVHYMARANRTEEYGSLVRDVHGAKGVTYINLLADGSWDDSLWWVLAYCRAGPLLGDTPAFVATARAVFDHVDARAWGTDACGGGVWWSHRNSYKNAITNELYIAAAAQLYLLGQGQTYLDKAQTAWRWFVASSMIDTRTGLANDGLTVDKTNTSQCTNNHGTTWTYNQGVLLGAAVDLAAATGNATFFIPTAVKLADATLSALVTADGILSEPCPGRDTCNLDQTQFKGIFARNLGRLARAPALAGTPTRRRYCAFLQRNADSVVAKATLPSGKIGGFWQGPVADKDSTKQDLATNGTGTNPQVSGLDVLSAIC